LIEGIEKLTVEEIKELYKTGAAEPTDVVDAYLGVIDEKDPSIQAFLHVFREEALARAGELDIADVDRLPLFGIPVAVKDNICTKGLPTTCASKILENYRPPYNATAVERLLEAGAIIIGKTNMDEFAMGSSTENSAFKITRNPWNLEYAPGGSSGGSAAAVAAGMVPLALGSDTGGSIRQPASFCGVVGLKGTYGRVSRYGLVAFASSLDQIGPFAKNVRDTALLMEVISGHDPHDSTSIQEKNCNLLEELEKGVDDLRIGIPEGMEGWEIEDEVRGAVERAVRVFEDLGKDVRRVKLPDFDTSIACYYILADAEASSNLARYDGVKYGLRREADSLKEMYERTRGEGFGEEVKRRILIGTYVLSAGYYDAYYAKAQQVRAMMVEGYNNAFDEVDVILLPTSPTPAFRIGEKIENPIEMYLSDIFTTTANIAGIPAVSIPAGLSGAGLPIGVQLLAGLKRERELLRTAHALEKVFDFHGLIS